MLNVGDRVKINDDDLLPINWRGQVGHVMKAGGNMILVEVEFPVTNFRTHPVCLKPTTFRLLNPNNYKVGIVNLGPTQVARI